MPDASEQELLDAARKGDADALDALFRRYQPQVYRFGVKMCRDPEDAREVLQETLLAAARSMRTFRGGSSLSTWLYTIARSFCIKKRRRRKLAPPTVSLDSAAAEAARAVPDLGRSPERLLDDQRLAAALDEAIASLDPGNREVLVLRDVEGLSAAETAQVTRLSVEAVKSRLHRARAAVRRRLAPLLEPAAARRRPAGCPDIVRLFSRYLEGDISPRHCADMERHLASCAPCQRACDSLKSTLRLCRSSPALRVPEALQESIRDGLRSLLAEGA